MAIRIGNDDYLSAREASELLGVKPATLYAYVSRGLLQSYRQRIRRERLYRRAELEALLSVTPSPSARPERQPQVPRAEDWIPYVN